MLFPLPKLPPLLPILGKVVKTVVKVAKGAWNLITGKDEVQEEISNQMSFNPEKIQTDDIAELNRMLNEYRKNISAAAGDLEREMIIEYAEEMKEIMDTFEEYNKTLKVARSETIKRRYKRMSNDLKGTFEEYISKRISLDDPEFVKVLKLPSGELKNQRLQEMKQKIFIEAKDDIIRKIKDAVDDFMETVEDAFTEHLDRAEESVREKGQAFEELSDASRDDTEAAEKVFIKADYIIALCSCAENIV